MYSRNPEANPTMESLARDNPTKPSSPASGASVEVITTSHTEKGSLVWTISKYSHIKNEEHMTSPLLEIAGAHYYVILYPNGKKQQDISAPENPNPNAGFLSLWGYRAPPQNTNRTSVPPAPHHPRIFTFTLIHPRYEARSITCKTSMHNTAGRGYNKFISHEELEQFLSKDDSLKLKFEVEVRVSINTEVKDNPTEFPTVQPCTLKRDFEQLLQNEKHSDVTLRLDDGSQLRAHTAILCARSSVFNAMFEHNMKEKSDRVVKLDDISLNELKEMLCFIYTGSCTSRDALTGMANHLFVVSDRYDLPQLRNMCEISLLSQISVENVIHLLLLADRHRGSVLKEKCIEFIYLNGSDIAKTEGMKQLYDAQNISLLKDVMECILAGSSSEPSAKKRKVESPQQTATNTPHQFTH